MRLSCEAITEHNLVPTLSAVAQLRDRALPIARPYVGWALDTAIQIECETPSFVASTFYFGPAKRQAAFSILAELVLGTSAEELASRFRVAAPGVCLAGLSSLAQIGRALVVLRPKAILDCLGPETSPDGLLGVLTRLGVDVAGPPERYRELRQVFASRDLLDRKRARVLTQIEGDLSGERIAIVLALVPDLLHPAIASKLSHASDAARLNGAFAHIQAHCSAATAPAMRHSLGQIGSKSVERWLSEWAARFDRLPDFDLQLPSDGPELSVLGTGSALQDAGRRFRNCLAERIPDVLTGRRVYLEHAPESRHERVVVELRRTSLGWLLEDLHGPSNRRVPKAVASAITIKLARAGVATYTTSGALGPGFKSAAYLLERASWERAYKLLSGLEQEANHPEPLPVAASKAA